MPHSHGTELMGGSRWRTPAEQWKKTSWTHRTGMLSVGLFFPWRKFGGKPDITVNITVFPFDAAPPHPSACIFCLLSSLWSWSFQKRFASVSWSVRIQQSDFFLSRNSTVYFFCYSGEWQKSPNWAHKVAVQRLDREASLQHWGGNLIAQALQRPCFTQFPMKEDWICSLWLSFEARSSHSPTFFSVSLTSELSLH